MCSSVDEFLLLVLMGVEDAKIKLPMDSMILIVKEII
jgi:hypothetical protein